jgi:large subunit ribosomal protein L5
MAKDNDNKPQASAEGKPAGKPEYKGPKGKPKDGPKKGGGKGYSADIVAAAEKSQSEPQRLKVMYDTQVRAKVAEKFGVKNPMAMPKIDKVVINVNMGRHLEGTKIPPDKKQTMLDTVTKISGQRPVVIKAKKSVSNFKLRAGFESSVMVTMRRDRMWNFLDRVINLATPRIKDFRGLSTKAFDAMGNYSFGFTEQGVFPEINMAEVTFTHGMHVNVVFKNSTPDKSRFVLEQLGMPFAKPEQK